MHSCECKVPSVSSQGGGKKKGEQQKVCRLEGGREGDQKPDPPEEREEVEDVSRVP